MIPKDSHSASIVCVGLISCDIMAKPVNHAIFDKDTTKLDNLAFHSGGDALNVAVNLSQLGIPTSLIGCIGKDELGSFIRNELGKTNIDYSSVIEFEDVPSSASIVLIKEDGERHFLYRLGANEKLSFEILNFQKLFSHKFLHVGSAMALPGLDGIPLAKLFEKAKSRGIVTSLDVTWDSSGNWFSKIQSVLEHTDFFFPSYQEAVHISGKYDIDDITAFFNNFGFTLFGVKLGSKGLYLTDFSSQWKIPPISSNVIDTTGAGDACVAGLLAGIIKKLSPSLCGKLGSLTASECISHYGATEPSKDLTYLWSKIDE